MFVVIGDIMRRIVFFALLGALAAPTPSTGSANEGLLRIKVADENMVGFQYKPLSNPKGGDPFAGSDFIHPLKTPSGFIVTDLQPEDHLHHYGLWWPWKYIETEGRKVLCWELQEGEGIIEATDAHPTAEGFTAESVYIDRKAPGNPQSLLQETLNVKISPILMHPVSGYNLDLEIIHEPVTKKAITVINYRYSGFSLRGASAWNHENSTILTSEGHDRDSSNFTRATWVCVQGTANEDRMAGVLLMGHPDNHDHPESLRTWDKNTHNGAVFINFNPVQKESWVMEPGQQYIRKYRVFVYDGMLSAEDAEKLWIQYIRETTSDSTDKAATEEIN